MSVCERGNNTIVWNKMMFYIDGKNTCSAL